MHISNKPRKKCLNRKTAPCSQDKDNRQSLKQKIWNKKGFGLLMLLIFAFSLNAIELNWGLSGAITWQPDAIEGEISLNHMPLLFQQWRHKYPRGQFLINGLFYKPMIDHWKKNPAIVKTSNNDTQQTVVSPERLKTLAAVSRWIVAVMSLGTIVAVFLTTLYLSGDYLSAWLSGFILSATCLFVFYSSIGHIDVPFTFWYAWACCFCVLSVKRNQWCYYISAALCAGYAVCTKEGYSMYIVGLAAAYCTLKAMDEYEKAKNLKESVLSIISLKTISAGIIFVGLFLLMSGFLGGSEEFTKRINYMSDEPLFKIPRTQLNVFKTSFGWFYKSIGWPILLAWGIGIFYLLIKNRKILFFVTLPLIVFYILTIMRFHFCASRYFVPACTGIAVLTGYTLGEWLRFRQIPLLVRYIPIVLILGMTFLYCIGMKLEMRNDTRNRVEAWFNKNAEKDSLVGSGMKRWYAPRLKFTGYKMIDGWHSEGVPTSRGVLKIFPEYLIMSNEFPCSANYKDDKAFKKELYEGRAGYKQVASFRAMYFYPSSSLFGLASWPYKPDMPDEWISPAVDIFRKEDTGVIRSKRQAAK